MILDVYIFVALVSGCLFLKIFSIPSLTTESTTFMSVFMITFTHFVDEPDMICLKCSITSINQSCRYTESFQRYSYIC